MSRGKAFMLGVLEGVVLATASVSVWFGLSETSLPAWVRVGLTWVFACALGRRTWPWGQRRPPKTKIRWMTLQRVNDAANALPPERPLVNYLTGEVLLYSWWRRRRFLGVIPMLPALDILRADTPEEEPLDAEDGVINAPCVIYRFVGRSMRAVEGVLPFTVEEGSELCITQGRVRTAPLPVNATREQIAAQLRSGMNGQTPDEAAVDLAITLGGCVVYTAEEDT